jgi:hypothetical protein
MHFDGEFTELGCHKLVIACQPFCCHHWEADCFASPHLTTPHNARVLSWNSYRHSLWRQASVHCSSIDDGIAVMWYWTASQWTKGLLTEENTCLWKIFRPSMMERSQWDFFVSSWSSLWMSSCYVVSSQSHKTSVLMAHHHRHHHQVVLNM